MKKKNSCTSIILGVLIVGACVKGVARLINKKDTHRYQPKTEVSYPKGYKFYQDVTVCDENDTERDYDGLYYYDPSNTKKATIIYNEEKDKYRARIKDAKNNDKSWYPVRENRYGENTFTDSETTWLWLED